MDISNISSCKEIADFFFKDEKSLAYNEIIIKQGISGDVITEAIPHLKDFGIKGTQLITIRKYVNNYKEKFKPKIISEKIPISNKEVIKNFFEKFIDFKGDLEGKINEENDLFKLEENDMKNLGLNFGQRIRLIRYINYFKELKENEKEKMIDDIKITISKNSNQEEVNNYLKNVLLFSDKSIEEFSAYSELLFELSEDDLDAYEDILNSEEMIMLRKFIKKRNEIKKKESQNLSKNTPYEEIINFIKQKLNFDIDKNDISDLKLDEYENLTKEEKEIIRNALNQKNIIENKDNNISVDTIKFNDYNSINESKDEITTRNIIKEYPNIKYSVKENVSFHENSKFNFFFILDIEKISLKNLEFAAFITKGSILTSYSYIHYDLYLINISEYKNDNICKTFLLFQIISDHPMAKFSLRIINKEAEEIDKKEICTVIKISNKINNDHIFMLNSIDFDTYNIFPIITDNDFFTEYLNYFNDEKNKIKPIILKNLVMALNDKISSTKSIDLSVENILTFLRLCGNFNISPIKIDSIKFFSPKKTLNKNDYIDNNYIESTYSNKDKEQIFSILLQIYLKLDLEFLLQMIISNNNCCRVFFNLLLQNSFV